MELFVFSFYEIQHPALWCFIITVCELRIAFSGQQKMMDIRRCPGLIKLVVKLGGGASIKQQLDNKHKLQVCVVLNELNSQKVIWRPL